MIRIFLFLLSISFLNHEAKAQEAAPAIRGALSYGSELRPEKDINGNVGQDFLTNYSLGVGYQNYLFLLEHATFEESSESGVLSVRRKFEDTLLWAQWRSIKWSIFVPYLGGGIGAYREQVTTQMAGVGSADNRSSYRLLGGACFGVNLDLPVVWISLEGRMLFGDEFDQQPTLGAVGRIGIWF